jgi:hypothetical protein
MLLSRLVSFLVIQEESESIHASQMAPKILARALARIKSGPRALRLLPQIASQPTQAAKP